MADLFIIGQYEGVAGTTAVHMLTVMIVGLAMGTTVSIARAIGADDRPQAAAATGNTVTLFLSLSLVLTAGLLLLRRPITAVMVDAGGGGRGDGPLSDDLFSWHSVHYGV